MSLRWQTWVRAGLVLIAVLVVVLAGQRMSWLRVPYGPPSGGIRYGPGSTLSPRLATTMDLYGLGEIPPWIIPPLGGSSDAFVAAGPEPDPARIHPAAWAAFTGRRRLGLHRRWHGRHRGWHE